MPACKRCGRNSHTAESCYASYKVNGVRVAVEMAPAAKLVAEERNRHSPKEICERCCRNTHTIELCYASRHLNGSILPKALARAFQSRQDPRKFGDFDINELFSQMKVKYSEK
jgi:hypothetical protein